VSKQNLVTSRCSNYDICMTDLDSQCHHKAAKSIAGRRPMAPRSPETYAIMDPCISPWTLVTIFRISKPSSVRIPVSVDVRRPSGTIHQNQKRKANRGYQYLQPEHPKRLTLHSQQRMVTVSRVGQLLESAPADLEKAREVWLLFWRKMSFLCFKGR
jgi:hypothetical protein